MSRAHVPDAWTLAWLDRQGRTHDTGRVWPEHPETLASDQRLGPEYPALEAVMTLAHTAISPLTSHQVADWLDNSDHWGDLYTIVRAHRDDIEAVLAL